MDENPAEVMEAVAHIKKRRHEMLGEFQEEAKTGKNREFVQASFAEAGQDVPPELDNALNNYANQDPFQLGPVHRFITVSRQNKERSESRGRQTQSDSERRFQDEKAEKEAARTETAKMREQMDRAAAGTTIQSTMPARDGAGGTTESTMKEFGSRWTPLGSGDDISSAVQAANMYPAPENKWLTDMWSGQQALPAGLGARVPDGQDENADSAAQ